MQPVPMGGDSAPTLRVLIVDDDVDVRESTGLVLKLEGYQVELASCAAEALAAVANFKPHIAFVDIGLGRESGYDLPPRIRDLSEVQDMVLVAMSGYGDSPRSRESGFDLHLTKPVEPDALLVLLGEQAARFS